MLTPLTIVQRDVPPAHVEQPRLRTDFEFLWLLSGSLRYTSLGAALDITPDMLLFRRPGLPDLLEFSPTQASRTLTATFALDPRSLPPCFPPPEAWPNLRLLRPGDILRPLFRHLLTHVDCLDHQTDPPLVEQTLSLMLHVFATGRTQTFEPRRPVMPEPVQKAIALIRRRIATEPAVPLTSADLLAASGLRKRSHLEQLFRQHTGHTPTRYFRLARLDLAAQLLRHTDWPLEIIAATTGLRGRSHLAYLLHHYLGFGPTDFRRLSIAGQLPPLAPLVDIDAVATPGPEEPDPDLSALPDMVVPTNYKRSTSKRNRIFRAQAMHAEPPERVIVRRTPSPGGA